MSSNDALTHTGVPAIDVSVRWGLALSGGGVPGIAGHLGFIAGLGIPLPPVMVGTSAGGLVAGELALGTDFGDLVGRWSKTAADPFALIPCEAVHAFEAMRPRENPGLWTEATTVRRMMRWPGCCGRCGGGRSERRAADVRPGGPHEGV